MDLHPITNRIHQLRAERRSTSWIVQLNPAEGIYITLANKREIEAEMGAGAEAS